MRKALFGFAAIAAAVLAVTSAHAQQAIKIGVILPYSGQFADGAAQLDNAIKLYVKQHGDTVAGKKLEFIRKDQGDIKTGQTLILGRLDTFINQVGVQTAELTATPAGRAVADRLTELGKSSAEQEGRIGELAAWRDEIRGAVRLLSIFSALSSAVATVVTLLHLAHVAGW